MVLSLLSLILRGMLLDYILDEKKKAFFFIPKLWSLGMKIMLLIVKIE